MAVEKAARGFPQHGRSLDLRFLWTADKCADSPHFVGKSGESGAWRELFLCRIVRNSIPLFNGINLRRETSELRCTL
jgi:hypothetical protein